MAFKVNDLMITVLPEQGAAGQLGCGATLCGIDTCGFPGHTICGICTIGHTVCGT